jgi:hypothetical protein
MVVRCLNLQALNKLKIGMFLHSMLDLVKIDLLPQVAPKYVPNTIMLKQIDGALN